MAVRRLILSFLFDKKGGGPIHAAFDSTFEIADDTLRQCLVCSRVFKGRHIDPHLAAETAECAARQISLILKNYIMHIPEFPLRPCYLTGHSGIERNGI
jgi:hypothetical protein